MVKAEQVILFDITGFDFESEMPYNQMVSLLHTAGYNDIGDPHHRAIQHLCWCLVSDTLYTNLCLRFTGDQIARGVISAASKLGHFEVSSQVLYGCENSNQLDIAIPEVESEVLNLYE